MTVVAPILVHGVTGIVDWYDAAEHAGYIICDYGDLIITEESLKDDCCALEQGQLVTCNVCQGVDNLKAMEVVPIDSLLQSASFLTGPEESLLSASLQVAQARRNSFRDLRTHTYDSGRRIFNVSDAPGRVGRVVRVFSVSSGANFAAEAQANRFRAPFPGANWWIGRRRRVFNVSTRTTSARTILGRRRFYNVSPAYGVPGDSEDLTASVGVLERLRSAWGRHRPAFLASAQSSSESDSEDERPVNVFTIRGPTMRPVSGCSGESKAKAGPGFDTGRFEGPVPEELMCTICCGVLNSPVLTSCDHLFCRYCIARWLAEQSVCPMDRQRLRIPNDVRSAPRFVKNMLGGLRLRCNFADKGCECVLALGEVEMHESECQYRGDE